MSRDYFESPPNTEGCYVTVFNDDGGEWLGIDYGESDTALTLTPAILDALIPALQAARARMAEREDCAVESNAMSRTIFNCRTCDVGTWGSTSGEFDSPGWSRIENIDGPDAICPDCQTDPDALEALLEDYPNARVAFAETEAHP